MVRRLIGFAFVVLKLLVFKVCGIIGISKIEFFNFSDTERVNVPSFLKTIFISNNNSKVFLRMRKRFMNKISHWKTEILIVRIFAGVQLYYHRNSVITKTL